MRYQLWTGCLLPQVVKCSRSGCSKFLIRSQSVHMSIHCTYHIGALAITYVICVSVPSYYDFRDVIASNIIS